MKMWKLRTEIETIKEPQNPDKEAVMLPHPRRCPSHGTRTHTQPPDLVLVPRVLGVGGEFRRRVLLEHTYMQCTMGTGCCSGSLVCGVSGQKRVRRATV